MSRHSYASSSCFVTVMNSGPKNTAFTPSILYRLRIFLVVVVVETMWLAVLRTRNAYPGPRDRIFFIPNQGPKKIPDPRSASKNLSICNPKNCFSALGNMIRDVHPGTRIPEPGS
jgi:hypothetical protein